MINSHIDSNSDKDFQLRDVDRFPNRIKSTLLRGIQIGVIAKHLPHSSCPYERKY